MDIPQARPDDDHSLQEYLFDLGYAACLGLLGYAMLRLSVSKTFWGGGVDFTAHLWDFYHRSEWFGTTEEARIAARWSELLIVEGIPVVDRLCFGGRPVRLGLAVAGLFIANNIVLNTEDPDVTTIYTHRSFFSVTPRLRIGYPLRHLHHADSRRHRPR